MHQLNRKTVSSRTGLTFLAQIQDLLGVVFSTGTLLKEKLIFFFWFYTLLRSIDLKNEAHFIY